MGGAVYFISLCRYHQFWCSVIAEASLDYHLACLWQLHTVSAYARDLWWWSSASNSCCRLRAWWHHRNGCTGQMRTPSTWMVGEGYTPTFTAHATHGATPSSTTATTKSGEVRHHCYWKFFSSTLSFSSAEVFSPGIVWGLSVSSVGLFVCLLTRAQITWAIIFIFYW